MNLKVPQGEIEKGKKRKKSLAGEGVQRFTQIHTFTRIATLDDMSDLSTKQRAAIAALLEGQTQAGAATAAGVNKRQVQRWLIQPDFAAELRKGSDAAIRAASARLAATTEHAVNNILATMTTPTTPGAAVRLRAADALLSHALRIREHADILERLAELERQLNENQ